MGTQADEFKAWELNVRADQRRDPLWRVQAYRLGRFAQAKSWPDVIALHQAPSGRKVADQLWRSIGGIPASIAEGYSRSSTADRVRFMEYSLGSAREAICWYAHAELMLPARDMSPAIELLGSLRNLLLTRISSERRSMRHQPSFGTPAG